MSKYVVLVELTSVDGTQRWWPGAQIELDDERALVHMAAGNVAALPDQAVVAPPAPLITVHGPVDTPVTVIGDEEGNHGDSGND